MVTARSGRLFSGVDNSAELVLFESARDSLDHGVSTALITKFISQCGPSSITHVRGVDEWTEFDCTAFPSSRLIVLSREQVNKEPLWKYINSSSLESEGNHLVVLDSLKYLVNCYHAHGLVRTLHDARIGSRKILFAVFMHSNDFDNPTVLALRSISTTVVEVEHVAGDGTRMLNNRGDFQVWDDLSIRIQRKKSSGRVNVDRVSARFDSQTNTLLTYTVVEPEKKQIEELDLNGTQLQQYLPFRVTLSSNERSARAAVALPYAHTNTNVADGALVLHPKVLQVANYADGNYGEEDSSDSDYELLDDEGDELFSEDV